MDTPTLLAVRATSGRATRVLSGGEGVRLGALIVAVWLCVGVYASYGRQDFSPQTVDCPRLATILLTTALGPLNYLGVDSRIETCALPAPLPPN